MAAIEWVDQKLKKWGEYTAGADSRFIGGYCSSVYNPDKVRGWPADNGLVCSDVLSVDIVMASVKKERPELYRVGKEIYVHGLSFKLVSGRIGCSLDTVYARRDALHRIVGERLVSKVSARS